MTASVSTANPPKTFLVCHGAWSAGWAWKKMHPLMQAAGHRLITPSYTGLGERAHLAHQALDLEAHIQDVLNVISYEDLRDIVLVGHSYGGMVATGVADRVRERIAQMIYIDAFVPRDGQSLFDLNEAAIETMRELASDGDGWRIPPMPTPPDTSPADVEWLTARRVDMPIKCFEQKLQLKRGETDLPRSYIYATRATQADTFGQFARRTKHESGWRYFEIDASQTPAVIVKATPITRGGAAAQMLDIEGITLDGEGGFWLASEGRSDRMIPHGLYHVNAEGEIEDMKAQFQAKLNEEFEAGKEDRKSTRLNSSH